MDWRHKIAGAAHHVGFTAHRRGNDPYGQHFVTRAAGGTSPAHLPVSYSEVSRFQRTFSTNTTSEATPPLETRISGERGLGLFCTTHIPAYSRVLEDYALLSMASGEDLPQLWEKYLSLPIADQQTFDALSPPCRQIDKEASMITKLRQRGLSDEQAHAMARVSSRFQGNAFYAGTCGGDWAHGYVLFPTVARINHSCTPNAHSYFRASGGAKYVYALRDIRPGEEIEIAYSDLTAPFSVRQQRTQSWSFTCQCPACSGALVRDYEARLALVHAHSLTSVNVDHQPGRLEGIQSAITTAQSEANPWLRAVLPNLYANLVGALSSDRRGDDASVNAARSAVWWQERVSGSDSPQANSLKRDLQRIGLAVATQTGS